MENVPAGRRSFPPEVAMHTVKLACERPDDVGRSLSHWDCAELARQLISDRVVDSISPQTVQRILAGHQLKPWRKHLWLSSKVPRDEEFCRRVKNICSLYTRKLKPCEMVLCVDEKTSLQPRPRQSPTLPAQPGLPVRVEHEYERSTCSPRSTRGLATFTPTPPNANGRKSSSSSWSNWTARFPARSRRFIW
jgi:hypothetical protein